MKILKLRLAARVMYAAGLTVVLLTLALGVVRGSGVVPTNTWADIYSSHSTFAGVPIPVGAYVAVFDPQGTQCGERTVTIAGQVSPLMPVTVMIPHRRATRARCRAMFCVLRSTAPP